MCENGNETLQEEFKLHGCAVRVTIEGGQRSLRYQAMHELMTFIDSKKPPRKRRRTRAEMEAARAEENVDV
tara:strand:- start:160 stop:372 length:213 start_codon:yes stop_codon:yes gene_type:complete